MSNRLKSMIDSIINDNTDSAKVDFHSYLQDKFRSILHPGSVLNTKEQDVVKKPTPPSDEDLE